MKKLVIMAGCLFIIWTASAQEVSIQKERKHEIKINALNLVLGNPELDYEYLINKNSGVGLSVNVNMDKNEILPYNYMVTPFYRLYVGNRDAAGFFFEGSLTVLEEDLSIYNQDGTITYSKDIGFGPGVAIGAKFLIKSSIIFEFYGGVGRNFSARDYGATTFPRIGVSIGKRF